MMTQSPETDDSVPSSSDSKVKCAVLFRKISPEYNPILENSLANYQRRLRLSGTFFCGEHLTLTPSHSVG